MENKNQSKKGRKKLFLYFFLVILVFVVSECGVFFNEVDPVTEQSSVKAGDTLTSVLHTNYKVFGPKLGFHLVAGILAPKSWKAGEHTKMYFESNITSGIQSMEIVPANELAASANGLNWPEAVKNKLGFGSNASSDLEWIIFWSTNTYDVDNGMTPTADITIKVKTGPENLQYKRGYFLSESIDAFSLPGAGDSYATGFFTNCFTVTDGEGESIDFCNPKISIGEPSNATIDDILTIKYDGDLDVSELKNQEEIYLCAKAYTSSNQTIEVCSQLSDAKLKRSGLNKWRVDLWTRKFFNLQAGQELTKIEYYFTDKTGNLKTGFANTDAPFKYIFKCL